MAKNNYGKLIAFTTVVAAAGGVCYVFRDKIKDSPLFKSASKKANDICDTVKSKVHTDDHFYFDDWDEEPDDESNNNPTVSNDSTSREYTSLSHSNNASIKAVNTDDSNKSDEKKSTDKVTDTAKDIAQKSNDNTNDIQSESIPTIDFPANASKPDVTSPEKYENENLSDTSEDSDVLAEQDKLDF